MKRKIFSMVLVFCMLINLLPMYSIAEGVETSEISSNRTEFLSREEASEVPILPSDDNLYYGEEDDFYQKWANNPIASMDSYTMCANPFYEIHHEGKNQKLVGLDENQPFLNKTFNENNGYWNYYGLCYGELFLNKLPNFYELMKEHNFSMYQGFSKDQQRLKMRLSCESTRNAGLSSEGISTPDPAFGYTLLNDSGWEDFNAWDYYIVWGNGYKDVMYQSYDPVMRVNVAAAFDRTTSNIRVSFMDDTFPTVKNFEYIVNNFKLEIVDEGTNRGLDISYPWLDVVKFVKSRDESNNYIVIPIGEDIRAAMLDDTDPMKSVRFHFTAIDRETDREIYTNTGEGGEEISGFDAPIIRINDNYFSREDQKIETTESGFPWETLPANTLVVQIPDSVAMKGADNYTITNIQNIEETSPVQFYEVRNVGYEYNAEGEVVPTNHEKRIVDDGLTTTCSITDLAGNPLKINYDCGVIVDNRTPEVIEVGIAGVTQSHPVDQWAEDISTTNLYRKAGDEVSFYVDIDEPFYYVKPGQTFNPYYNTNLKYGYFEYWDKIYEKRDNKKAAIKLSGFFTDDANKDMTVSCNDVQYLNRGVNEKPGIRLVFEPLTIPEGAVSASEILQPSKMTTGEDELQLEDFQGNLFPVETDLTGATNKLNIKLDTAAPDVTVGEARQDDEGITIPLTIKDNGSGAEASGTVGLAAIFRYDLVDGWRYPENAYWYESGKLHYELYIDDNENAPDDSKYYIARTQSEYRFGVTQETMYAHIKVDKYPDIFYKGEATVSADDWAGNNTADTGNSFAADMTAPSVTLKYINKSTESGNPKFTASLNVMDNSDSATVYYEWVKKDEEPTDEDGWNHGSVSLATEDDNTYENVDFNTDEYKPAIEDDGLYEYDLLVKMKDNNGNESDIERFTCQYDISTVENKYIINSDLDEVLTSPDITVIAPEDEDATTIVVMEYDGEKRVDGNAVDNNKSYITFLNKNGNLGDVIATSASAILFDGDLTWYGTDDFSYDKDNKTISYGALENGNSQDLSDINRIHLDSWYGNVKVTLLTINDSEFTVLTGGSSNTNVGSMSEDNFVVKYAGNLYANKFEGNYYNISKQDNGSYFTITNLEGSELDLQKSGENKYGCEMNYFYVSKRLNGNYLKFNIENTINSNFGIEDLDFENSYVDIVKLDTKNPKDGANSGDSVAKISLQNSSKQAIMLPNIILEEGKESQGLYAVAIYLKKINSNASYTYTNGGNSVEEAENGADNEMPYLLLDTSEVADFGIYQYSTWLGDIDDYAILEDGRDIPSKDFVYETVPDEINISLAADDGPIATHRSLQLGYSNNSENNYYFYDDDNTEINLGVCRKMRIWNKTRTDGAINSDGAGIPWKETDGNSASHGRWDIDVDELNLNEGDNTLCMQVELYGGEQSNIKEFTIHVDKDKPTLDLLTTPLGEKTLDGKTYVRGMEIALNSAISNNGAVETYLYQYNDSFDTWDGSSYLSKIYEKDSQGKAISYTVDEDDTNKTEMLEEKFPYNTSDRMTGEVPNADTNKGQIIAVAVDEIGAFSYILSKSPEDGKELITLDELGFVSEESGWNPVPRLISFYTDENDPRFELYLPAKTLEKESGEFIDRYSFIDTITAEIDGQATVLYGNGKFLNEEEPSFTPKNGFYSLDNVEDGDGIRPVFAYIPEYDDIKYNDKGVESEDGAIKEIINHTASITICSKLGEELTQNFEDTEDGSYYNLNLEQNNIKPAIVGTDGSTVEFNQPVKVISPQVIGDADEYKMEWDNLAIFKNGEYSITFEDAYGTQYTDSRDITLSYENPLNVTYSTMEPTKDDVTITLTVAESGVSIDKITVMDSDGKETDRSDIVNYSILKGKGGAIATFKNNARICVYIEGVEEPQEFTVFNIDKEIPEPGILWNYLGNEKDGSTFEGSILATVFGKNETVTGKEGSLTTFIFTPETGTTPHVFTVVDAAGNEKSISAIPKYDLIVAPIEEIVDLDNTVPAVAIALTPKIRGSYGEQYENVLIAGSSDLWDKTYDVIKNVPVEGTTTGETEVETEKVSIAEFPFEGTRVTNDDTYFTSLEKAQGYRLEASYFDRSNVKYIWKNELAEEISYNTASDSIDGILQNGRAFDITKAISAYLYVVDEKNNFVTISVNMSELIDNEGPPIPSALEESYGFAVRVYLIPKEDGSTFTCSNAQKAIPIGGNTAYYYHDFISNSAYTYYLKDEIGNITPYTYELTSLDMEAPALKEEWSANNIEGRIVNQDIVASITANKTIQKVELKDNNGETIDSSIAEVSLAGRMATVTFKQNPTKAVTLRVTSSNYKSTDIQLLPLASIDRNAPIIQIENNVLADDLSSRTYTFISNKRVSFGQGIYTVENDKILRQITDFNAGETMTALVSENGEHSFVFTDMAGNQSSVDVTAEGIDNKNLVVNFSNDSTGLNPVEDVNDLDISKPVYFKANKSVQVKSNSSSELITQGADSWWQLNLSTEKLTAYPLFVFTHRKGSELQKVLAVFTHVNLLDTIAPVIETESSFLRVDSTIGAEELNELLISNVTITDVNCNREKVTYEDEDANNGITVTIKGIPLRSEITGYDDETSIITYIAVDAVGNSTEKTCSLRFYNSEEIVVSVEGDVILENGSMIVESNQVNLMVESKSGQPYSVYFKSGYKTKSQVKVNSNRVAYQVSGNKIFALPSLKEGFNSILIRTQDRRTYIYYIYID